MEYIQNKGDDDCQKELQCFHLLNTEDFEFLKAKKTLVTYLKGETIFKQGAFAPYVLYVMDGFVKIFLQTGGTKQINIRLARHGDFIAFTSIFSESVYGYTAVAVKDSIICMIDKTALKELLMRNSDFAMRITSRNCQNEKRYLEIIHNISYKQMRGKLASALLYLSEDVDTESIFPYLSRQDIADFASITIESTVKFLKEFEKEGVITLEGKDIFILDKNKLNNIYLKG